MSSTILATSNPHLGLLRSPHNSAWHTEVLHADFHSEILVIHQCHNSLDFMLLLLLIIMVPSSVPETWQMLKNNSLTN
jgi:hypothetical protein